ncbi:MORN repeat protein [Mariniflexile fucanivorans]|uniref:MORN repeat protein n=1 Tax=Mariniflexile fucanivorans TaxID=264023 RepID=A0A4R1RFJ7_9FLAO|nr:hypothetical protein [Mariniflexile fucanivorans]TCL64440.1 MORN repeat protein [Mariniflexile fucanivorans]
MIKPFLIVLFALIFSGCHQQPEKMAHAENTRISQETPNVIDNVLVAKNALYLNQKQGTWYYNKKPFNGFSVKFYPNGVLEEQLGFYKGKREGVAKRWSDNGVLRVESFYNQNKLVGIYKSWWENGLVAEESTYVNGFKQGIERQWHDNGTLSKLRHMVDGEESGMQQAWLKNGTLYINYEAKNGRIFGLLKSNLCYQLENEVVIK